MITEVSGNLLRDDAEALVNTVNTVGVMGKGLALQFKRAFPDVFAAYQAACRNGAVVPGRIHTAQLADGHWVLNFPTKRHWRDPSRLEDVEAGLDDLVRVIKALGIRSIAVPPLGCGNGGLPWPVVRRLIMSKLDGLEVDVRLYGLGTPAPEDMPTATSAPDLDQPRVRFLASVARYIEAALATGLTEARRLSLVEAQKIAYLVQAAGTPLGLRFEPHLYGPYSNALNQELSEMEGHHTIGFGDGTGGARADLRLTDGTASAAEAAVADDAGFDRTWSKVAETIAGYMYPDGMELLASVHLLAVRRQASRDTVADALAAWSPRKRQLFRPDDAVAAWDRLNATGMLKV